MNFIVQSLTIFEDLGYESEHELEWSLTVEHWAISKDLTSFIHKVYKWDGSLRNQFIDDTLVGTVALDDVVV